ncbi:KDGP aldolase [Virgibacillus halodenitrificans]|uniref:2-dehydro-3-deoxy-phosphogluconate aldolase n=1 Tax=Virgibacillus halodenitrificans TaxID=1482 RepID=UPI001FB443AD|nr:KDGP aldolase [Virgibacillus halodenitrificans]MCJ0931495.1 KDGP aldolase [Virgibacillus halodenitrificans]
MQHKRYYNNKICLNVLANSIENAKEIYHTAEGHAVIGLLASNYTDVDKAVDDVQLYGEAIDRAISLGLGGGDPNQWKMVTDICRKVTPEHINQVFPAVAYTRACVQNETSHINCLVNPAETPGYVNIATGPMSAQEPAVNIPVRSAITLISEMGGNAIKLFPMNGLAMRQHYVKIAEACGEAEFILEPTGGITVDNFEEIVSLALEAGVPKVIPHVYSSIMDPDTGITRVEAIKKLFKIMKKIG